MKKVLFFILALSLMVLATVGLFGCTSEDAAVGAAAGLAIDAASRNPFLIRKTGDAMQAVGRKMQQPGVVSNIKDMTPDQFMKALEFMGSRVPKTAIRTSISEESTPSGEAQRRFDALKRNINN